MKKIGVLILNLGTPASDRVSDVRRYLGEFLMDPYVVDISWIARFLLVHGIILRTRPKKSADAYQKIWTDRGSPLLFHSEDLEKKLAVELGETYSVKLAMRYGKPSVSKALSEFKTEMIDEILFVPLYPQYSWAATESSVDWVRNHVRKIWKVDPKNLKAFPEVKWVQDFFVDEGFIDAFVQNVQEAKTGFNPDFYLFSFHGIPERHVKMTDDTGRTCLSALDCCDKVTAENRNCYRAQCFATAKAMAGKLGLKSDQYSVSFQSRLGRTPWIKPYTDFVYAELADKKIRSVLVICPSFVADCLETLEEIAIRGRAGYPGDLRLVPSLNSSDHWVRTLAGWVQGRAGLNSVFKKLKPFR